MRSSVSRAQSVGPLPWPGGEAGPGATRRHLLTVGMEDYYQVAAFQQFIQQRQWNRFEQRVEAGTRNTLALLDQWGFSATFFVLGWVADSMPELVREVAERGHEVASKGYYHRSVRLMTPAEFREDLARAGEAIERATGQRVQGYRVADGWFGPADLWALDVLAQEGYEYDSSIAPFFRRYAAEPWRRFPHRHSFGDRSLLEFPISTAALFGWNLPIAGGNYLRQLPAPLMRRAVAHWHRTYHAPLVFYFHTWELDPQQPRIGVLPFHQHIRAYRNIERMPEILQEYLGTYRFSSIRDSVGLSPTRVTGQAPDAATGCTPTPLHSTEERVRREGVTLVVPCYNEELVLPYLANALREAAHRLGERWEVRYVFVDDGSTDGTAAALSRIFGPLSGVTIVRHPRNLGLAAAIRTGLEQAETEIVCSIDCDCSYDPLELGEMIPLLEEGTALVVASPYHPLGRVRNVPRWRLRLSRTASRLYRAVLGEGPHTFTSCCRVYRRTAISALAVRHAGYLGVAELTGRAVLSGLGVAERPVTLEARLLGRSKMRILRTILGHLGLLAELAVERASGRGRGRQRKAEKTERAEGAEPHFVPTEMGQSGMAPAPTEARR